MRRVLQVVITEAAYDDLAAIGRYIRADSPRRAETFVREVLSRCERLGEMPRAFPLLPRWEDRGIRRRPFGNYLNFCRIVDETVEVLRVIHGARDYEAILFPKE